MGNIIRATTPTIVYKFKNVKVEDITVAILSIRKEDVDLEKDLTSAAVGEDTLSWTLTQDETLAMAGKVSIMLNWKLADGTRGASAKTTVKIDENYKPEVI